MQGSQKACQWVSKNATPQPSLPFRRRPTATASGVGCVCSAALVRTSLPPPWPVSASTLGCDKQKVNVTCHHRELAWSIYTDPGPMSVPRPPHFSTRNSAWAIDRLGRNDWQERLPYGEPPSMVLAVGCASQCKSISCQSPRSTWWDLHFSFGDENEARDATHIPIPNLPRWCGGRDRNVHRPRVRSCGGQHVQVHEGTACRVVSVASLERFHVSFRRAINVSRARGTE